MRLRSRSVITLATLSIIVIPNIYGGLAAASSKALKSSADNTSSSSSTNSSPITQSYTAPSGIYPGMLVASDPKHPNSVIALTSSNINKMLGVVVPVNNSVFSITPTSGGTQQVLVGNNGQYSVLVINSSGNINSGDSLTMSPVAGVAMLAGPSNRTSIGQAEGNFNGKTGVISQVKLKNSKGVSTSYSIGSIMVNVHLGQNNQYIPDNSGLPQFVISAVYTIAKKPVSPAKIYLGFIIIFAVIIVVSTMFYSGTKNGIISIGRNPLSRKSIARGLIQTIFAGLSVFAVGLGIVYVVIVL